MNWVFYYKEVKQDTCFHCGHVNKIDEIQHIIGSAAMGWRFTFRKYPKLQSTADWVEFLADKEIFSDDGKKFDAGQFFKLVFSSHHYPFIDPKMERDSLGFPFSDVGWSEEG